MMSECQLFLEENQMHAKHFNHSLSSKTEKNLNKIHKQNLLDSFVLDEYINQTISTLNDYMMQLVDNLIKTNNYQCIRSHYEYSFKDALKFTADH